MRLLKTRGYQLFETNEIPTPFPQYAILSHTWISPKDEITYQDLKQRKGDIENDIFKQKGWAKLRRYCDRAVKDGWEWAWMDTCCIDKTNPADTQEAINAMFRWYQNASICYAHLDDVNVDKVLDGAGPSRDCYRIDKDLDTVAGKDNVANPNSSTHTLLKAFLIESKWFTRGWTLQELLAPPYLVFVDHSWRRIGTRESWADEIKTASRIEARHLTSFDPTNFTSCSIAMRLSWASRRETTVEEDETYSLLGLFGISLPLIYGEGRWRAFNRLQRELITVYNDDSIFAWKVEQSTSNRWSRSQQKDHDEGRGILAPSIRDYWGASDIQAFGFHDNIFSMTNRGLEINAKRWRRKDDPSKYLIRLNCGLGPSSRIAIHLEHVNGSYNRIHVDKPLDMGEVSHEDWEEEVETQPTIVRASNYANVLVPSSIFVLEYPEQIKVGEKYLVDFKGSSFNTNLKLLGNYYPGYALTKDEVVMEPNQLVFINIELWNESIGSHFDIIINLTDRSFPTVGILSRGGEKWERLGDPLRQSSDIYENLADHLHHKVTVAPDYPVFAVEEMEDIVIGTCLLPKPRKERSRNRTLDKAKLATSREYVLKITVEQQGDHRRNSSEHRDKRRRYSP